MVTGCGGDCTVEKALTPEPRRLGAFVDRQLLQVRQDLQFCIAVALEENGGCRLINTAQVHGRTWYSYESVAGEVFSVVRPEIGAETEREVREWLARLVEEEVGRGPRGPATTPCNGDLAVRLSVRPSSRRGLSTKPP